MTAALPLALACLVGMGLAGGAEPSAVCVVAVLAVLARGRWIVFWRDCALEVSNEY